jgi:hypothetical protein
MFVELADVMVVVALRLLLRFAEVVRHPGWKAGS